MSELQAPFDPRFGELTHSQRQIWIGQSLHPDSPLYNMAFAFVFPAELRAEVFCEAWQRVADSSDALRTRLQERRGGGVERVVLNEAGRTALVDLTHEENPEATFRRWCEDRSAHPLSLTGDLVDSVLARFGDGRTGWYLNQHHLVADAWSTQLLFRHVGEQYEVLLGAYGGASPSPPSYYETVAELLVSPDQRTKAQKYWTERLERPGRSVSLYGRGAEPVGTASTRLTLEIDEDRSRALDALARQEGFSSLFEDLSRFTLFATLLASWLHRVSGASDVGFDAPVAGRPTPAAKRALGLFIEMFPFVATVKAGDSFRSLGARCLKEAMLFLRHALPGLSAPSGATASNIVLNYVPGSFGTFAGLPVEASWVHPGHGDSVHALRLQVHDFSGSGRYTLHFDGNEGALPRRFRERSLRHFEKILDACLADPDSSIASVDLLGEEERQALVALNSTASEPLPDRSVVAMFHSQADLVPDRVALRQGTEEVSFSRLRLQSEALAATLLERGVDPGDRVAIVGRRSTDAVIAILGALRARTAYVPIEPSVPSARLEHVVRDSGARIVLVGYGVDVANSSLQVPIMSIAEGIEAGSGVALDHPEPGLGDLAYLIYTSGSTGQPKGVPIEHGGLAAYLEWASRTYVRGDRLTYPLFSSLAFDLTVTSLFLPLITGGTLEIYPQPDGPVDTALMDVVAANSVDFIKLTPSHLSLLVRMGLEGSRIRRMVVGGENLATHLAASFSRQLHDEVEIYNEYGPTEAVVGCVAHRYQPEIDTGASVPIGAPAEHVEVEVLNEALSPVPVGAPGELWVSRFGLARGYYGLPELTAERFAPNSAKAGQHRYRTGDLVRMVDEEKLEYLGRLDRQLKISGHRVEPAEIEAALLSVPTVEACAVIGSRRSVATLTGSEVVRHCVRCGLPSNYPRGVFDEHGVCSACQSYDSIKDQAHAYFKSPDDLRRIFEDSARTSDSQYDCMMLFSGGKDSTYALCKLIEMGLSVYAFTLDNGFISEDAKENIRKVTDQLDVPVEFATTPAMNDIFRDSLMRFSNVCNGCFKTIYTLSMKRARDLQIPIIVTGLSRGQMFETRLTEEMFRDGRCSPEEVDAAVLAARKVYHRVPDEVSRALDVEVFQDDRIFEEIRFVDFYRYVDIGLGEVYAYLKTRVPWVRPDDTGRSTNCLINDVGIYVHNKERGFHNYALPYSWDVRLGHKDREAAMEELDDNIDLDYVRETLATLGYDENRTMASADQTALHAFYVTSGDVTEAEVRRQLGERLPPQFIPTNLQRVDSLPLTASGKIDEKALARGVRVLRPEAPYRVPQGPVAEYLVDLWQRELEAERIGADDSFFELGGTSLSAMEVMIRLCQEYDIDLPLETLFSYPRLADLARVAEDRILADVSEMSESERRQILADGESSH